MNLAMKREPTGAYIPPAILFPNLRNTVVVLRKGRGIHDWRKAQRGGEEAIVELVPATLRIGNYVVRLLMTWDFWLTCVVGSVRRIAARLRLPGFRFFLQKPLPA